MFIISKTIKGKEFMYSNKYSILCNSQKQAQALARFLNEHNDTALNDFKLKDNELWYVYEIDQYDTAPQYKISQTKGKISIKKNITI